MSKSENFAIYQIKSQGSIPKPPANYTWENLMAMALKEAQLAEQKAEVPVGAVLVHKSGQILALAHNQQESLHDPSAHAEILALRAAAKKLQNYRLSDTILVVTLEPCLMCLGAILHARLNGLVFGAGNSLDGAILSNFDFLQIQSKSSHPPIWYLGGVLSNQCALILQNFFAKRRG